MRTPFVSGGRFFVSLFIFALSYHSSCRYALAHVDVRQGRSCALSGLFFVHECHALCVCFTYAHRMHTVGAARAQASSSLSLGSPAPSAKFNRQSNRATGVGMNESVHARREVTTRVFMRWCRRLSLECRPQLAHMRCSCVFVSGGNVLMIVTCSF